MYLTWFPPFWSVLQVGFQHCSWFRLVCFVARLYEPIWFGMGWGELPSFLLSFLASFLPSFLPNSAAIFGPSDSRLSLFPFPLHLLSSCTPNVMHTGTQQCSRSRFPAGKTTAAGRRRVGTHIQKKSSCRASLQNSRTIAQSIKHSTSLTTGRTKAWNWT